MMQLSVKQPPKFNQRHSIFYVLLSSSAEWTKAIFTLNNKADQLKRIYTEKVLMKSINCSFSLSALFIQSALFVFSGLSLTKVVVMLKNKILPQCSRLCRSRADCFSQLSICWYLELFIFPPAAWPELLSLLKRSPQRDALIIPLTNNGYWWAGWSQHHAAFWGFEGCEVMCLLWRICGEMLALLRHDCLYTRHSGEDALHHGFLRLTTSCFTGTGPVLIFHLITKASINKTFEGLLITERLDSASQHLPHHHPSWRLI